MTTGTLLADIASARTAAAVAEATRRVGAAMIAGDMDDAAGTALFEALGTRRAEILAGRDNPARCLTAPAKPYMRAGSLFPAKAYRPKPDPAASLLRRRRLAASGGMPPAMQAQFTVSPAAVLRIVADEHAEHGVCTASVSEIAARAGVSDRTVQLALADARRAGLLEVAERPRRGGLHDTNLVTIVSPEWLAWIAKGQRPGPKGKESNFSPPGQGYSSKTSAHRGAQKRATEGAKVGTARPLRGPAATTAAGSRPASGAMPEAQASVRPIERPAALVNEKPKAVPAPGPAEGWDQDPVASPTPPEPKPALYRPTSRSPVEADHGFRCLSPRAAALLTSLRRADAEATGTAQDGQSGPVAPSVPPGAPSEPHGLEADRHGLAPRAPEPLLMGAGGGHDGEPVEGSHQGAGPVAEPLATCTQRHSVADAHAREAECEAVIPHPQEVIAYLRKAAGRTIDLKDAITPLTGMEILGRRPSPNGSLTAGMT